MYRRHALYTVEAASREPGRSRRATRARTAYRGGSLDMGG